MNILFDNARTQFIAARLWPDRRRQGLLRYARWDNTKKVAPGPAGIRAVG